MKWWKRDRKGDGWEREKVMGNPVIKSKHLLEVSPREKIEPAVWRPAARIFLKCASCAFCSWEGATILAMIARATKLQLEGNVRRQLRENTGQGDKGNHRRKRGLVTIFFFRQCMRTQTASARHDRRLRKRACVSCAVLCAACSSRSCSA